MKCTYPPRRRLALRGSERLHGLAGASIEWHRAWWSSAAQWLFWLAGSSRSSGPSMKSIVTQILPLS